MNFDFSDDIKAVREEAKRFLQNRCPPAVVRRVLDGAATFDKELWTEIGALGWLGAGIPEELGGAGIGYDALCVLAGEIGASLAPVPFSSSAYLAAEAIMLAGDEAQKRALLPEIASGESITTLALAEGPGNPDPAAIATTCRDGRLSGTKWPVPDGAIADHAVVVASDSLGSIGFYRVSLEGEGVERRTLPTIDPTRNYATLTLAGAPAQALRGNGEGWALVQQLLDRAAVFFAFEQVGGAEAALMMARDYALERYAFGRPIASFQAIKHKLADIYVAVELARAHAYYAAWALSHDARELASAASAARVAASQAYYLASRENIQIHGGMGFTWEMNCHLHYRRAKSLSILLGSESYWQDRLIGELEHAEAAE
ncbi:MAG TPA: acyl-CoA dehydrogenase family protein [Rhizomicrobium sp.]|nr:acyl-CoA dehydrogenase family protein [Rhizomicrobium sp.]